MKKVYLKNWQDKRGTETARAKALIADKNTNLTELSKKTNIPYQSLVNYRADISKLDKASWQRINVLSQVYDILEISNNMTQDDVWKIQGEIHDMFNELRKIYKNDTGRLVMIKNMEEIITSDPVAVYEIFKSINSF